MGRTPPARWARLLVLTLGLVARSQTALGDEPADAALNAVPPRVDVAIVGRVPGGDALGTRVQSWFAAQPTAVSVRAAPVLATEEVLAKREWTGVKVWVVLRSSSAARLFFAVAGSDEGTPRYLVRDVTLAGGLDELGMEQVTQVIYLSALALWTGTQQSSRQDVERGLAQEQTVDRPETPPPVSRRVSSNAGFSSVLGAGYFARFAGDEGTTHALSTSLGVGHPVGRFMVLGRVEAALLLPHRASANGLTLDLRGASFAAGALLVHELFDRTWGAVELGAGADVVNYRALAVDDPALQVDADETEARPFLRLRAGAARALGPVSLGVGAGVALQLLRTHYDAVDGANRSEIFAPWPVQPELHASATW